MSVDPDPSTNPAPSDTSRRALVIGASRSLGLGLVRELAERGWEVVGTVRSTARTPLHELADASAGRIAVLEQVDVTEDGDLARLGGELLEAGFDLLFVNAGITDADVPAGDVDAETFAKVMVTNALAPLHTIEALAHLVRPDGTIAVMSSRQGSISLNDRGGHEVYRASKSALNQLMRSYDARRTDSRTVLLVHPGWVQTELGGVGAPLTVEESAHGVVNTVERHASDGGLQFRNYLDEVVPW